MAGDMRFEEYRAIAQETGKISDRRQTVNDLFLGVNSLFLTAAGFAVVSSDLATWWATGICAAIAAVAVAINVTWIHLIHRYRVLIELRIRYMEGLEKLLQADGVFGPVEVALPSDNGTKQFQRGIYLYEAATLYQKNTKAGFGFNQLERRLAWIFIIAYLLLTVVVATLTYLIMIGMIDPLKLTS
jgi:hypothetical protein